MKKLKVIILDYGGVIFDPKTNNLVPGIMDLIKYLRSKHYTLALVSKAENVDERWADFKRLGLYKLINSMEVFPLDKPKNFDGILKMFDVAPEECIILGDYVKSEIKEGNKLGMTTVWYKNGEFPDVLPESEEEKPNYQIGSISEFKKTLKQAET